MSKSLHEIAEDYLGEVARAVEKVSKLANAREEPSNNELYSAIKEAGQAIEDAGSRAKGAIADSYIMARKEIFS